MTSGLLLLHDLDHEAVSAVFVRSRERATEETLIMQFTPMTRKVKYEADMSGDFAKEIASTPGNKTLLSCIQCGTCSGTCPSSLWMDYTPRRIIGMTRAGFKKEVLQSFTIWLCASCYSCTVDCPKNIKITDIMYALKRAAMHENLYPKTFPVPVLAREFHRNVLEYGRNSEARVVLRTYLKSRPFSHLSKVYLGFRLWMSGRLQMGRDRVRQRRRFTQYLDRAAKKADRARQRSRAA
jgi:heterodisulfide reductase subunit C